MPRGQRPEPLGADTGLALLRDHDILVGADLSEGPGDGAVVSAGAHDDGRAHALLVRLDRDATGHPMHAADTLALAHHRPGCGRPAEQERVELGAHDAVARHVSEVCLVLRAVHRHSDRFEGLDRLRVVHRRVQLEVAPHGGRHPSGTQLDAREGRGIDDQHPGARACQPPGGGAAAGSPAHHDRVEGHAFAM